MKLKVESKKDIRFFCQVTEKLSIGFDSRNCLPVNIGDIKIKDVQLSILIGGLQSLQEEIEKWKKIKIKV